MSVSLIIAFVGALLAGAGSALFGVGLGALLTYRLMNRQSPLPPLRRPAKPAEVPEKVERPAFTPPMVRV